MVRAGEPDVWLIFHGVRHRIASPRVFDALFRDAEGLIEDVDPYAVSEGVTLEDGSCLVTPDEGGGFYLVIRGEAGIVRRHLVVNWESWCDFRFDQDKLATIPRLVLEGLPRGRDLSSQNGRSFIV